MKFGYEGVRNEELIQKYKVNGDKITIMFLDGTIHEVDLTEENENDLLSRMLKQAQERNESLEMNLAIRERRQAFLWAMYLSMIDLVYINTTINATTDRGEIFGTIVSGIVGLTIVINGSVCKARNDEIRELKKYAIYLNIRDRFEEMGDKPILLGENGREEFLNINTLDDYSLHDIKVIRKKLGRG